jgi:hypothetical protein
LAQPKIYWRPKYSHALRPKKEIQQSPVEDDESGVNSVSPPIYSASVENPNGSGELAPPLEPEAPRPSSTEASGDQITEGMENFKVYPTTPFVPKGMNVEDWARPARGRIIITANPPRCHEEYAIISIDPLLQQIRFMKRLMKYWNILTMSIACVFVLAVHLHWVFVLLSFPRPLLVRP